MAKPVDNTVRNSGFPAASEQPAPRISGFVQHSSNTLTQPRQPIDSTARIVNGSHSAPSVGDVIRSANADLEQQAAHHLTIPLTIAVQQRDRYIAELCREREAWQQELARQAASFNAQILERDAQLNQLREQLRDAEKELAGLRVEPKTIIGVAPDSSRSGNKLATSDSGEHAPLQTALEAAWQDVEDARLRLAALEQERDAALKEADELRVELYDKLASARDEVIEAETHLTETQRAFDDAKEQWDNEQARLRAEAEEARQALVIQLEVNTQLRQSLMPQGLGSAPSGHEIPDAPLPSGLAHPVPLVNQVAPSSSIPPSSGAGSLFADTLRPPAFDGSGSQRPRSLSALVGFESDPPAEDDMPLAVDFDEALGKRKSFGFGRLFRSKSGA